MTDVKFELNPEGVRELMKSDSMIDILNGIANQAADQLGDGYEVTTVIGTNRANAEVAAVSHAAKKENYETNSILKAIRRMHD